MNEYRQFVKACLQNRKRNSSRPLDVPNMFMELIGELGEAANAYKHACSWSKQEEFSAEYEHLKEEMGDLLWYVFALCEVMHLDVKELMEKNRQKLNERYGTNL